MSRKGNDSCATSLEPRSRIDDTQWDLPRIGFGSHPNTCTITASEDRWAEWVAANSRELGLRKKGLPHFDLCTEMFSAFIAIGNIACSSAMPPLDSNELDGSHPTTGLLTHSESGL
ncbi:hypothetical protein Sango_1155900 [Sesamum angolense]|uniref:Uncharacterized protein n=1 Tax=Sesamum angolense TaxID=2727404 RepID=A0AAE1WWC6_9LAMI|nr:hypothetical protein Sango_1155900 [Sesamum angolense]